MTATLLNQQRDARESEACDSSLDYNTSGVVRLGAVVFCFRGLIGPCSLVLWRRRKRQNYLTLGPTVSAGGTKGFGPELLLVCCIDHHYGPQTSTHHLFMHQ